jgi:hypothetical protein
VVVLRRLRGWGSAMNLHQIVITKNVLGQYKLSLMGDGVTQETIRGNFSVIAWRAFRHLFRLVAVRQ